jgi:hypothetical protein
VDPFSGGTRQLKSSDHRHGLHFDEQVVATNIGEDAPCMAGCSVLAPSCMVAGPNGLVLKFFFNRTKFKICFKFGLKIKK